MTPRTGRRPGESGTRDAILDAARTSFSENGYDRATIRDVARRARVDPALVHHYFDNKKSLFIAAVEMPIDPAEMISSILDGDPGSVGKRIARTFIHVWDGFAGQNPLVALLRSATSNPDAARMIREFVAREILGKVTATLELPRAELRAALVGSQLMGVALLRYVIALEPIASTPGDELADIIAPTLQRYLTGDLPVTE